MIYVVSLCAAAVGCAAFGQPDVAGAALIFAGFISIAKVLIP